MEEIKYKYFPHTAKDIKEMLERIGVKSIDDLFSDIPAHNSDLWNAFRK